MGKKDWNMGGGAWVMFELHPLLVVKLLCCAVFELAFCGDLCPVLSFLLLLLLKDFFLSILLLWKWLVVED